MVVVIYFKFACIHGFDLNKLVVGEEVGKGAGGKGVFESC